MWLPMMFAVRTLVVSISAALVFLVDLPGPALSHPQCLDFAPPYDDQQVRKILWLHGLTHSSPSLIEIDE